MPSWTLLADLERDVLVLAGDAERGVAEQFAADLGALRGGVTVVHGSDVTVPASARGRSRRGSTLIVVDIRRYERWLLDAFEQGRAAGHTLVALSDGVLSPLAMSAQHSFTISAASVSPFDSHVGTLALFDLLVATTAERLRTSAAERRQRVESAWAQGSSLTER